MPDYNESQARAIAHFLGPCLVLAGPGSGKTTVITERTRHLIADCGVAPGQILVVTFTKAAAGEMRLRFEQLTDRRWPGVSFGTFHAVFFTILKHAYHYTADNIAREEDKYRFLREIIARSRIECEDVNEFCSDILGEISALKNGGIAVQNYYPVHCGRDVFVAIYREYSRYMADHRLIDFDDILVYTRELLEQREDIRRAWQCKFPYIMVDEFQDINRLQYEVVRMLAGESANLFAVGDDDQSIYRFRGSRPELMLNFPKDYPQAEVMQLTVNYRCPARVVQLSGRLIAHNRNRYEKQIESAGIPGDTCCIREFQTVQEENRAIIELIRAHLSRGGSYSQIAVLYRTNVQPGALIARLMEYNLPFRTKERIPNLYNHWIAQDLAAYFRLALGSQSRKDMLRIMNRPMRYISRESLPERTVAYDAWQEYYSGQPWIAERIEQLEYDLKTLARITPYAAVNYIRRAIGYDAFLAEYARSRQIAADELFEVLDELQESTKGCQSLGDWLDFTAEYTKELAKKWERRQDMEPGESISIMTLHGAKGLEFDLVIIPDLNAGVIPYKKAVLEPELEEERRMLYVGMTRAKKELHLYHVRQLRGKHAEPSPFLLEITG